MSNKRLSGKIKEVYGDSIFANFSLLTAHFYLPFTLPGLAVLLVALLMLIHSLSARNAYEILLSSTALLLLITLASVGAWAVRRFKTMAPIWKPPLPLAAASREDWLVVAMPRVPWFFRLHFLIKGRFFPQGGSRDCAVFAETSFPRGTDTARLKLVFPLGGLFEGEGQCRLRDIFGLFSFPCGRSSGQTFKVRNAPCGDKPLRIDALSGAEDRRSKSSNEERYYMREYAPGDRLRDINWKSSERIDSLITRISPDNQEKVSRIDIFFRNYGPDNPSIGDLWLLDRSKARLAWFIRSVKEDRASFIFDIRYAQGSREIREEEEIDAFLEELSSLSFSVGQSEEPLPGPAEGGGELYVFSTACDKGLPAFLLLRQGQPLSLFIVRNALSGKAADGEPDNDFLRLRDFPAEGFIPLPHRHSLWFTKWQGRGQREAAPQLGGSRVVVDYAGIRF